MSEMSLLDWAVAYIKYKDSIQRKIKDFEVDAEKGTISLVLKDETKAKYLCVNILESINIEKLKDEKVVCLNKKENLNWLINKWDILKEKKCVFLFVNIKKSENWAINPHIHHSVTDKSALKPGLKVLFESISSSD